VERVKGIILFIHHFVYTIFFTITSKEYRKKYRVQNRTCLAALRFSFPAEKPGMDSDSPNPTPGFKQAITRPEQLCTTS
jgi:hypothetical protein